MLRTSMKNFALIILGFICYHIGFSYFEAIMLFLDKAIQYRFFSYILTYIIIGIPIFMVTAYINKNVNFLQNLGLQSNIITGILTGIIFSAPMFIGSFLQLKLARDIRVPDLIAKTLLAGFFEELYFRGYLFGQLFRNTRLGFLPAILLCSVLFALSHLYQSHDPGTILGIFITTFMGSVLFAWLFVEWNYNLWVPIFLHSFMNLSWYIFAVSDNALGSLNANIFRGCTIALSIILTLVYKKRKGEKASINKRTLVIKKEAQGLLA